MFLHSRIQINKWGRMRKREKALLDKHQSSNKGKNHPWMLKSMDKRMMRNQIFAKSQSISQQNTVLN